MVTLLWLLLPSPARALDWPDASLWTPVLYGGSELEDVCGDVSGSAWWDIVGDADEPAAWVADDGENLWFRLRLAAAPYSTSAGRTSWRSFG